MGVCRCVCGCKYVHACAYVTSSSISFWGGVMPSNTECSEIIGSAFRITLGSAQKPYGASGIEPKSVVCKMYLLYLLYYPAPFPSIL